MTRPKGSRKVPAAAQAQAGPARVSIRTIYSDAMREVMGDPRKAIAEHDPWLAALLTGVPKFRAKT